MGRGGVPQWSRNVHFGTSDGQETGDNLGDLSYASQTVLNP